MRDPRGPWDVPDEPGLLDDNPVETSGGIDTDGDGCPDTTVTDDGFDLVLATDLDGDGLADQVLRIGADGGVAARVHELASPLDAIQHDPLT